MLIALKNCALKLSKRHAEFDDKVAEKFLNEEEISIDEIKAALRKGIIERKIVPAFCGTAFKNKGVQLVLDAVIDYLPSPIDSTAGYGNNNDSETRSFNSI